MRMFLRFAKKMSCWNRTILTFELLEWRHLHGFKQEKRCPERFDAAIRDISHEGKS